MAKPFLSLFAPRLFKGHNHAHDPGQHLWPVNSGSLKFMLRAEPLSEQDHH